MPAQHSGMHQGTKINEYKMLVKAPYECQRVATLIASRALCCVLHCNQVIWDQFKYRGMDGDQ
jgi:hypothetical protein